MLDTGASGSPVVKIVKVRILLPVFATEGGFRLRVSKWGYYAMSQSRFCSVLLKCIGSVRSRF